jgi:non-heme chloroperoxidase
MNPLLQTITAAGVVATCAFHAAAQSTAAWRDPSPHQVRFVTVDSIVRLEVLDWGGSGRPVVFIGCYLTAHAFDNIAPWTRPAC